MKKSRSTDSRPSLSLSAKKPTIAVSDRPLVRNIDGVIAPSLRPAAGLALEKEKTPFLGRTKSRQQLSIGFSSLLILALVVGLVVPTLPVQALTTDTWTTNADFSYNKVSQCQATTVEELVISATTYTDGACVDAGVDAAVSLASLGFSADSVIVTGAGHSVALKSDGTVWAWGNNGEGQFGNGTTTGSFLPVQVKDAAGTGYLTGVISVSAGYYNSFALKSDGTVWAWGFNGTGQLGDGTTTRRTLPVQVKDTAGTGYLTDVTAINKFTARSSSTLALKSDGTVWAWGNNYRGQLGDGTTTDRTLPVQVKNTGGAGYLSGVTAIAMGENHSVALKSDGTVWAWGYNYYRQLGSSVVGNQSFPVQVVNFDNSGYLSNVTAIDAGANHSLALTSDGSVWTWGDNTTGQLGDGTSAYRPYPGQVKDAAGTGLLVNVTTIITGGASSFAITADGSAWAWGDNFQGFLGDGTTTSRTLPVRIKDAAGTGFLSDVTSASIGENHSVAIKADGSVWAWGNNAEGYLGNGNTTSSTLPVQVKDAAGTGYLSGVFAHSAGAVSTGTLSGTIVDSGAGKKTRWSSIDWQTDSLPVNTSVTFAARTSADGSTWSDWSAPYSQTASSSLGGSGDMTSLPLSRYLDIRVTLNSSDNVNSPTLNDFSLSYVHDVTPPDVNASNLTALRTSGGAAFTEGGWINTQAPYFSWDSATDAAGGAGIQGYCLYLGTDDTADLVAAKGILGTSPLETGGVCQYASSGSTLDLGVSGTISTPFVSSSTPYYLKIKAIDNSGNVYAGPAATYSFTYDDVAPTNPAFISAPSQFISTKNVTMTWPTTGPEAVADSASGVAGLQYKIGSDGTWYGDTHDGSQGLSDVLVNDGSYQTNETFDYSKLVEGNNIIYFRTLDNAGNASSSYVTAVIKLNTASPTSPQNITATPSINTTNSFAFSWNVPASFIGASSSLTYCYTVNTLPSPITCTYTSAGQIALTAQAYATQPGANVLYVVARDEAGNLNYDTYGSVSFTANTPAPGIALNPEIADISTKSTANWKLALSWAAPSNAGSGVSKYVVYRSTDDASFNQIATTSGLSYVDSALSQQAYYYKIKACDSANNCGAFSETFSQTPTGRFTVPAELVSSPSVQVSTKKASFYWVTDRGSDSRIQYGTKSGEYFPGEITVSSVTKQHSVDLLNLEAGTTYYYHAKWTDEDGNTGSSSELTFTTLPAPKVKDVEVIKTTLSGAIIQFTTTDATKVNLFYGRSESFGGLKTINTSRSESTYTVELTGLDDGAQYAYKIVTFDADGNQYDSLRTDSFTTPPRPRISNVRFQPLDGEPTNTQKISWITNVPTNSIITYGKDGTNGTDILDTKVTTEHEMIVRGLEDNSRYFVLAQSRDADGNLAVSDRQTFLTALDSRPPKVSDIRVESSVRGNGSEARGQLIVSWKTDEPATSQVAYGVGGSTAEYTNKTAQDSRLSTEHMVVISDLSVSSVYRLQPLSSDKANNEAAGDDQSAIIGRATDSVLNIILGAINKVFGL